MKTPKHGRSRQAKADGFATASTERKYVESRSEAAVSMMTMTSCLIEKEMTGKKNSELGHRKNVRRCY